MSMGQVPALCRSLGGVLHMKTFGTLLVLTLLCFALPSTAQNSLAQPATSDINSRASVDPSLQMALGGGKLATADGTDIATFNVAAHSGPLGTNARGHVHAKTVQSLPVSQEIDGDVTCITVVGNIAYL